MTGEDFRTLLDSPEGNRVEFKSASKGFHFDDLVKYCVALANEGGGTIVFGVSDQRPRTVLGTRAFDEPGRTEAGLFEQLYQRIPIEEHRHEGKRVLLVRVPARLPGTAWQYKGSYWMRAGDALVPMSDEQLRRIHEESVTDFSAEICPAARLEDLDPAAIHVMRELWQRKAPAQDVASRRVERLLADAELIVEGGVTYAALILLGTRKAMGRHLAQAEIVFEYRSNEAPGPAAERHEFRQGFLPVLDEVWRLVNLRNDLQHFQHRFVVLDVPTFDERAVREAVLNAVSHRDYRSGASVFVRQYPRRIEIVSPGGFLPGITPDNVISQQNPRNRRIADVLGKCGLVERAGQGVDLIYRECILHGKRLPDFSRTDPYSVWLTLHGQVRDEEFLRFIEEIDHERLAAFGTDEYLIIDLVHREQTVPDALHAGVETLLGQGVLERARRGRGSHLLLSQHLYRHPGRRMVEGRPPRLDREANKALLLEQVRVSGTGGAAFSELAQVLPNLSRRQVQRLLEDLKREGLLVLQGSRKGARWLPQP